MDDDLKILVLCDEACSEDLIEYELSKANLHVIMLRVTSRDAFLKALQTSPVNLILISAGHKEIGALTALALAQEICPATPCFLINPASYPERPSGATRDHDGASRRCPGLQVEATIASLFTAAGITPLAWDKPEASLPKPGARQALFQVNGVIIAFLSPAGRILECNQGTERLTGWRRDEILGQDGVETFFSGTHQISAITHLQQVLAGQSPESIDLPLNVRPGLALPYRWHCNLVSDRHGRPAGIMVVGQHLAAPKLWEGLPRALLARACPAPAARQRRGLLTHRTGTC